MLEALLAAGGAVVSGEELLEKVWDENTDPFSNVVRVTVMTLRKKLGEPAAHRDGGRRRLPAVRRRTLSLRLRLTLSYGAVFFGLGFLLIAVSYVLVRQVLVHNPGEFLGHVAERSRPLAGLPATRMPSPSGGQRDGGHLHALRPGSGRVAAAARPHVPRLHRARGRRRRVGGRRLALRRPHAAAGAGDLGRGPACLGEHAARAHRHAGSATTSCASWPTPSTPCSAASRRPSKLSSSSSATRRTSCAPRWRSCAPRSRSPWPTRYASSDELRAMAATVRTAIARSEDVIDKLLVLAESERSCRASSSICARSWLRRSLATRRPAARAV